MINKSTYFANCPHHEGRSDLIKECKICDDNGLIEVIDVIDTINDDMMYMVYLRQKDMIKQYLREIEPFVQERVKLSSMFSQFILKETGEIIKTYPSKVEAMDKEYEKIIDHIREGIFGKAIVPL